MTLLSERHVPHSLVEPLSLMGRVCLVTGGASGLGAATARELGLAGANVAATIRFVLEMPPASVVPELTVLPLHETSWP